MTTKRLTKGGILRLFEAYRQKCLRSAQFAGARQNILRQLASGTASQAAEILTDDGAWRVALLGIAPGRGIPLHDHPGARGILYVLEGSVRILHYDVAQRVPNSRAALLIQRTPSLLHARETDWFGTRRRNLHAIQADGGPALIFSVRNYHPDSGPRSVYALIDAQQPQHEGLTPALAIPPAGRRVEPPAA